MNQIKRIFTSGIKKEQTAKDISSNVSLKKSFSGNNQKEVSKFRPPSHTKKDLRQSSKNNLSKDKTNSSSNLVGGKNFNNYLLNKNELQSSLQSPKNAKGTQLNSYKHLLVELSHLITPYLLSLTEKNQEAINYFLDINPKFVNDPWVLSNIAKCYTELSQHNKAYLYYSRAFESLCGNNSLPSYQSDKIEDISEKDKIFLSENTPKRIYSQVEGIEFYSSCLWHLKKQQELCLLANYCLEKFYFKSETWIVLANTYSLNQDHEAALHFLERSLKIDPFNAYAHCLSGHEYSCKEEFDKARESYQNAINIDPQNVRAYWGLGNLKLKMEKFDTAINYFMKAVKINNKCSTFFTQIGIAFMNKGELEIALSYMKKGEEINPEDPFNRYNKAYVRLLISSH
jgi:tetratricopeptide (TPR) repeat protein